MDFKLITKTFVIKLDGTNPTRKDVIIRGLCRLIPYEAFSALGRPSKPLHDHLSNTAVVDEHRLALRMQSEEFLEYLNKTPV